MVFLVVTVPGLMRHKNRHITKELSPNKVKSRDQRHWKLDLECVIFSAWEVQDSAPRSPDEPTHPWALVYCQELIYMLGIQRSVWSLFSGNLQRSPYSISYTINLYFKGFWHSSQIKSTQTLNKYKWLTTSLFIKKKARNIACDIWVMVWDGCRNSQIQK